MTHKTDPVTEVLAVKELFDFLNDPELISEYLLYCERGLGEWRILPVEYLLSMPFPFHVVCSRPWSEYNHEWIMHVHKMGVPYFKSSIKIKVRYA